MAHFTNDIWNTIQIDWIFFCDVIYGDVVTTNGRICKML